MEALRAGRRRRLIRARSAADRGDPERFLCHPRSGDPVTTPRRRATPRSRRSPVAEALEHSVVEVDECVEHALAGIELHRQPSLGEIDLHRVGAVVESAPDVGLGVVNEVGQEGLA